MLKEDGIPTCEDLKRVIPHEDRLREGPVAIVECFEEIPCNPCYTSCPNDAIFEFASIHDLPTLDANLCTGCGLCITHCPGLAIFVVDLYFNKEKAKVMIPWEMLPKPSPGDEVIALNRSGKELGPVVVEKVQLTRRSDRTMVISLLVPREIAMEVRSIKVVESHEEG